MSGFYRNSSLLYVSSVLARSLVYKCVGRHVVTVYIAPFFAESLHLESSTIPIAPIFFWQTGSAISFEQTRVSPRLKKDFFYDRPPQHPRFSLTKVSWLLDTRKDAVKNTVFAYFLVCKGRSNDDVRGGKGHRFFAGDTTGGWFQNRRFR